jgi:protein-L-isoaspartate O-methyltransferase
LESRVSGNPAAMVSLARLLQQDGQIEKALAVCHSALSLAPKDAQLAARARCIVAASVPEWHFEIVRDQRRNASYDAALRRAVTPDSRVLEIGTGTGLLSMMAARAGAADVVTCEMVPSIAEKAAKIVALNGYAERIRVVAKHSDNLDAEVDMGGRADILVSEIVSADLLGQHVLSAHERAIRDLLKPGALVIPARGAVRVALAHDDRENQSGLTSIEGFDLAAFNELAQPVRWIRVGHEQLSLRSEATNLFVFDFASTQCAPSQTSLVCRSTGGHVNGIAQWISLEFDNITRYENCPAPGATSCWDVRFYRFSQGVDTVAGQEVRIFGSHDRQSLTIWTDTDT